jgi:hypothetical protein
MYRATPEFADNITAFPLEARVMETTAGNYTMETFDLVTELEFSSDANGVDYVRVFHEGDSRPCIVAYAGDEKFGNQMLVDYGTNGLNTDGVFDESYRIDSLKQVLQMASGVAPEECSAGMCLEAVEEEQEE